MTRLETINSIIQLTLARLEILKLKADDYKWQVHTPDQVKQQLEETLVEIDTLLTKLKPTNTTPTNE